MSPRQEADAEDEAPLVLTWVLACADVDRAPAQAGYTRTWTATEVERSAIAEALDLTQCFSVSAKVTVHARAGGRYVVNGRLRADVEQACVVTLEAVPQHIDERFQGEFCPQSDLAAAGPLEAHFDADAADDPIAIVDGQLDVGQLAFENLALAIDPFPRAADAEDVRLERGPSGPTKTADAATERAPNPFAVLARLKPGKAEHGE
jgi:uncharacterized metal-binding protein YceD (DUF177 family)